MKLSEDFPEFTFWYVGARNGDWLIKTKQKVKFSVEYRIFCTLENSISLGLAQQFIKKGGEISGIVSGIGYNIDDGFYAHDVIIFAETRKVYSTKDLEELKRDYFIVQLSGLRQ